MSFLGDPEEIVFSNHLEFCLNDTKPKKIQVYICLYRLSNMNPGHFHDPSRDYVTYYVESHKHYYTFPSFHYDCAEEYRYNDEEEDDIDHHPLLTECILKILSTRGLHHDLAKPVKPHLSVGYKGFLPSDDHTSIMAVFDADQLEAALAMSLPADKHADKHADKLADKLAKHEWILADEILHKKSVVGKKIDSHIVHFFKKYPVLSVIRDPSDPSRRLDIPRVLFAVIEPHDDSDCDESHEEPMYVSETENDAPSIGMKLPHRYSHVFADRYLFTENPLHTEQRRQEQPYRRYIAFLDKPVHVFDRRYPGHQPLIEKYPDLSLHEMQANEDDDELIEEHRHVPTIYFADNIANPMNTNDRVPIWGFLNRNQVRPFIHHR